MQITLCNQKGGAGKTTLTMLLALALESIGRKVGIIDLDPQQTSTRAITNLRAKDLSNIELAKNPDGYDVAFFDTPPRLDERLESAISQSDRVILVSSPSPTDLWSTQESKDFVFKNLSETAKVAVLFNSVLLSAKISKDLEKLASLFGMDALQNFVTRKQAFQYAIVQGWDILKPSDKEQIKSVALEIGTM